MSTSADRIQALSDAVAAWRMEEYIGISFYCTYVYYVLSTVVGEVSIILPQRWGRGKMLYAIIRHGTVVFIALHLSRDSRNYFLISANACKVLRIAANVFRTSASLACDLSLALCLSALVQAKFVYLIGIVILSCGMPTVNTVINLVSRFQYPAEPVSQLDAELGYPCSVASTEDWMKKSVAYIGRDIRAYVNILATTFLALVGIATLVSRYKGQGGRLIQVIRRDGGLHFMSLLVIRMVSAIIQTPTIIPASKLDGSPVFVLIDMANFVVIPILAQRLLINMRKVDYMGSEPVASNLLFAPPAPGSEDDVEEDFDSLEMTLA